MSEARWTRDRVARAVIGGLGALVVLWFVVGRAHDFTLGGPHAFPQGVMYGSDSALYLEHAHRAVWSLGFLAARQKLGGGGPFPFLLLVKVCGYHVAAVVIAQGLLWIAAFRYLANSVAERLAGVTARIVATVAIWSLAIAAPLLQWTAGVATEALSIVTTAVAIGAAMRFVGDPTVRRGGVLGAALVAAALTRDTNALVGLAVVVVLLVALVFRRLPRNAVIAAVVLTLAGSATALALSNHARRWYYPLEETTTLRLQSDATARLYIVARGFPVDPAVEALSTPLGALQSNGDLDTAPQYASLRHWLETKGRRTYTVFLATHPKWVIAKPWADRDDVLIPDVSSYARRFRMPLPAVSRFVGYVVWPAVWWWFWLRLALVCGAFAVAIAMRRRPGALRDGGRWTATVAVLAVLGALWFAHALAAFHGDALEVGRHELTAMFQLQLTIWLTLAAALAALLMRSADSSR